MSRWIAILCLLILSQQSFAQALGMPEHLKYMPLMNLAENRIENSEVGLTHFTQQLKRLENGEIDRVSVVHIGDSHIQADFMSGIVRLELQKCFGNRGRGLVFPYKVSGTNSPLDIKSFSNADWESRRNIYMPDAAMPIGISGITMKTDNENFILKIGTKRIKVGWQELANINYAFNEVTLFHYKGNDAFDLMISICDSLDVLENSFKETAAEYYVVKSGDYLGTIAVKTNCTVSQIKSWNGLKNDMIYPNQKLIVKQKKILDPDLDMSLFSDLDYVDVDASSMADVYATKVHLPDTVSNIFIRGVKTEDQQNTAMMYGASLENTNASGVLYHTIGVNGAQYRSFNQSAYFKDQLGYLAPDLVIISLGTNESLEKNYSVENYLKQVKSLVSSIKEVAPNTDILFTTTADNYVKNKYLNDNVALGNEVVKQYACDENYAWWDLYELMGGKGSINDWKNLGAAHTDRVHFTIPGYQLQGMLLFQAIYHAYEQSAQSAGIHKPQ